ncbi:VWA domain-containing protein [Massilia sp. W12]|uniref:substrate-binding and vWA domain-containing protein n=1 Tax=Massilia sp. W12 TaxID=3126507 RepID=UPI0030D5597A
MLLRLMFLLSLALGLSACDKAQQLADKAKGSANASATAPPPASGGEFVILAGTELKDVAAMTQEFARRENINLRFEYSGTLDAVDKLKSPHNYDAVWISNGKYLQLIPQVASQIKASEKTMYAPVVLGVKPEVMKRLGWQSGQTSWKDVQAAAKAGKFRFGMTNPAGSNTGFTALLGLAAELSGKGDALEEKDIPAKELREFFAAQAMTAGSSGTLADMYAANPGRVDGIINYENVIRKLALQDKSLNVLTPKEGVITADYPLMLMGNSKQEGFYRKLAAWIKSDQAQQRIASETLRTPLRGSGSDVVVNELPFPSRLAVVESVLQGFMDSYSRPATSYFVLDVSGSMAGKRIEQLRESMQALAFGDGSTSGRFALLRAREQIHLLPFSNKLQTQNDFNLGEDREKNREILQQLGSAVNQLEARGGTAIFSSVAQAYTQAQKEAKSEERSVSIVLLTDGQNTDGMRLEEFRQFIDSRGVPKVPVFAILYGDAKQEEMDALAQITGGRVFDARKVSLPQVMREIRTYQ